ncbi:MULTISPECIES: TonB-dependent siderophore receptor [unclassified Janthinobacterium]|uniref:TonB-dependent siderophore receptor n=1 Tax=unclassified Janthinobacterium TaxID=2610881 RepID=UPI00161DDD42|nr:MULTISPECIES: TonB-dependent siderophore receptor [unclassified Janthinobacterium]MBB5366960.1 iron complex outermembrane receptor protein [Janthinobacterium sp. K2C7]MBB5380562.1 iron complex outermembrane receptor protein [Janthinobacterium sp. K2Li3]MBB5385342.1 iron complex outermembrane receptor protein [Janthinobacterium sp. K2E3]
MPTPNSSLNVSVSVLTLAILHAFAAPALAADNDNAANDPQSMAEVVVTASKAPAAKRVSVGGFSDAPLLQTPATVTVISQKDMQDLQIRNTSDAVKLDASINDSYNAVGYAEQFTVRGFALDNNSSYRKDGIAIPGDTQIPLENKERIEVLKGLSGLQAGMAAPGGVIDYIVKRPTATPLRTVTLEERERGTLYGALDLGGRLDDPRFGYRINVAAERLRSYIKGADGNRKFISGAFDWQISPQALLQLDADYQDKAQVTAPGFQLLSNGSLPSHVSADTMLNQQPWTHPVETVTANLGLRFQYAFNDDWHATLSANQHVFKRDDYTAYPYGCSPAGDAPVFCNNGDFSVWDYRSLGETKKPLSAQAMIQGKFATGSLRHEFTAGISTFHRKDSAGNYVYDETGISNIYHPVIVPSSPGVTGPVRLVRKDQENSIFVQDIISLTANWKLHAGLRHISVDGYQYILAADPADAEVRSKHGFLLPNAALVYNPLDNVAVYGAYSQGMEHGGISSIYTALPNVELSPSRSTQIEFGVKADLTPDFMVAVSLFQIRKGLEFVNADNYFVRAGQAQHRGLELSAQGKASNELRLSASATLLNSQQSGTGSTDLDGKRVPNVPAFKTTVHADYTVQQVAGLSVNGSWEYAGKKAFEFNNTTFVPSYNVFNAGAAYATRIAGTPAILRATVNNLFDKFYWRDVTPQAGGYLFPGASRTLRVSAQFDF